MGENEAGLTNTEYANWLNDIASTACGDVEELYIKHINNSEETFTDHNEICDWMQHTDASEITTLQEVKFSGTNGEGEWYAIDDRLTINLERTENFADVPAKIRRPIGT